MIELPSEAIGFHGTHRDAVAHLLARDIRPSDQHFDWLGTGFYLWQDSPWRARQWAEDHHGGEAAVVAARVALDGCLDLLNPAWQAALRDADAAFVVECFADGTPAPVNRGIGYRARDCATINWYCDRAAEEGLQIRSVRAVFEEDDPIFEASAIRSQSHLQMAIRDLSAILEIEEVTW